MGEEDDWVVVREGNEILKVVERDESAAIPADLVRGELPERPEGVERAQVAGRLSGHHRPHRPPATLLLLFQLLLLRLDGLQDEPNRTPRKENGDNGHDAEEDSDDGDEHGSVVLDLRHHDQVNGGG
eukprot:6752763-Prymnesium_polylepis.1